MRLQCTMLVDTWRVDCRWQEMLKEAGCGDPEAVLKAFQRVMVTGQHPNSSGRCIRLMCLALHPVRSSKICSRTQQQYSSAVHSRLSLNCRLYYKCRFDSVSKALPLAICRQQQEGGGGSGGCTDGARVWAEGRRDLPRKGHEGARLYCCPVVLLERVQRRAEAYASRAPLELFHRA